MGAGGDIVIPVKDAQTKVNIAGLESKAISSSRLRDIEAAFSEPTAARRIRYEAIGGIVLLVLIIVAFFILFFVIS